MSIAVLLARLILRIPYVECLTRMAPKAFHLMDTSPTDFYHMSATPLAVGDEIRGDGRNKIDARVENELEARKPVGVFSRRDAVYARPVPDFSRCGSVNSRYIYRVRLTGTPRRHDLNWLGPMQKALLKQKYRSQYPERLNEYPDWTNDLIARCCSAWEGAESDSPVWEYLAPSFTVAEILSGRPVNVTETRGGWSLPA